MFTKTKEKHPKQFSAFSEAQFFSHLRDGGDWTQTLLYWWRSSTCFWSTSFPGSLFSASLGRREERPWEWGWFLIGQFLQFWIFSRKKTTNQRSMKIFRFHSRLFLIAWRKKGRITCSNTRSFAWRQHTEHTSWEEQLCLTSLKRLSSRSRFAVIWL